MNASSSSHLWALVSAHQAESGVSTSELARRIGVSRQTLADWRTTGLVGRVPKRSTLTGLAAAIGKPYRLVLDAALADAGYFDDDVQYEVVAAAAVSALTAAGRLSMPRIDGWRQVPDWAEFVCETVATATANLDGTEQALSGRPGSWEADHVRAILASTLGPNDEQLWRFRTAPVEVVLPLAGIVDVVDKAFDRKYQAADDALAEPYQSALAEFDAAGALPQPTLNMETATPEEIQAEIQAPTVRTAAEQVLSDLEKREDELRTQLRDRHVAALEEYGERLRTAIETRLRAFVPAGVPIRYDVDALSEPWARDIPATRVDEARGPIEKAIAEAISETLVPPAR